MALSLALSLPLPLTLLLGHGLSLLARLGHPLASLLKLGEHTVQGLLCGQVVGRLRKRVCCGLGCLCSRTRVPLPRRVGQGGQRLRQGDVGGSHLRGHLLQRLGKSLSLPSVQLSQPVSQLLQNLRHLGRALGFLHTGQRGQVGRQLVQRRLPCASLGI